MGKAGKARFGKPERQGAGTRGDLGKPWIDQQQLRKAGDDVRLGANDRDFLLPCDWSAPWPV